MQQTDFSDSFIKSMLGWIRWIASSVANLFQGGSGSGGSMSMVTWFADNWIKILIALIIVGVLIDWLVWMARWRPYWVWFRKRRILLENDVDGIDEDDLMLHYGGAAARRDGLEDEFDPDLDDFDDIPMRRRDDFDEDEEYGEDEEYIEDEEYADEDASDDADEGFDSLYDDGRSHDAADGRRAPRLEADDVYDADDADDAYDAYDADEDGEAEDEDLPPREPARKKLFFARGRKKIDDGDDPFRIEGDFFDDLNDAPTREASPLRTTISLERDAQDTSVYQRPILLPGDEPGAVRGADEDENEAWHSGYTLRSAERGKRRKRDARA